MQRLNISSNPPIQRQLYNLVFKPVGVVLLPRKFGTLSSSLCGRQQIRIQHSYRPRIPRALCPCGLFHTRLRVVVDGVNLFWRHFRAPYRPHHQSLLAQSTQCHWRWNTIVCSKYGSYKGEGFHSKRRADLCCPTFSWKHIPTIIKTGGKLKESKQ